MSARRITISIPEDVARRLRRAAGRASVSAWVTGAIEERLDDAELERQFADFHASVAPSRAEVAAGDQLFERLTRRRKKPRAA